MQYCTRLVQRWGCIQAGHCHNLGCRATIDCSITLMTYQRGIATSILSHCSYAFAPQPGWLTPWPEWSPSRRECLSPLPEWLPSRTQWRSSCGRSVRRPGRHHLPIGQKPLPLALFIEGKPQTIVEGFSFPPDSTSKTVFDVRVKSSPWLFTRSKHRRSEILEDNVLLCIQNSAARVVIQRGICNHLWVWNRQPKGTQSCSDGAEVMRRYRTYVLILLYQFAALLLSTPPLSASAAFSTRDIARTGCEEQQVRFSISSNLGNNIQSSTYMLAPNSNSIQTQSPHSMHLKNHSRAAQ